MTDSSLLEGCKNIFGKNHEIWKTYFSKWETLANLEEISPDDGLAGEEKASEEREKKKRALLKKKRLLKKKIVREKKVAEKNKNKTAGKVIERAKDSGNENLPEERDNKQLEMHLRTIFMDILKANKNKWEVFAVLSQTFSHRDVTIKRPHSFCPNHPPALPSNDAEQGGRNVLVRKVDVCFPNRSGAFPGRLNSRGVEFFRSSLSALGVGRKKTFGWSVPGDGNDTFENFKYCMRNARHFFPDCPFAFPYAGRIMPSFTSCLPYNSVSCDKIDFKSPVLNFRQESTPETRKEIKNENFSRRNIPEMNISEEEKRFGSLCLHKRTNDLNMENSNFVTPERNPTERKCFSENISQRKRRRRTKLFFDFRDSSDSENDEQTKSSTPRIGWQSKIRKMGIAREAITVDSDSEESDSIL